MKIAAPDPIYLDHAAATPMDGSVLSAMQPYFSEQFYNPSALYGAAQSVKAAVESARQAVAAVLGARPAEIIFTAGGTEANNLAIHGVMRHYPDTRLLMSAIEHDSVLAAGQQYEHAMVPADGQGLVNPAAVAAAVDDRTVLVSVMYANNEIGSVQPVRDIGRSLEAIRRDRRGRGVGLPLLLHCDAAQAANYLDLQTSRLGVDLLTLNGGKIYGPKQSGLLYVRAGVRLLPQIVGGGQEHGMRSGTENVPAIIGLGVALGLAAAGRQGEGRRLEELRNSFIRRLRTDMPGLIVNGSLRRRLPNNVHITVPGQDNERLLFGLDQAGIMAAAGSACSASSDQPSHVLAAIGLSEAAARSSLRLTFGRQTDAAQLDRVAATLRQITSA